jgi:phospholipase C
MSTQQTATIYVTNQTDGNAYIQLFHQNSSNGLQNGSWYVGPNGNAGPFTANFETGDGDVSDYWSVILNVLDGSTPGLYITETGGITDPTNYKECMLESKDAGKTLYFTVSNTTFNINEDSGPCAATMTQVAPGGPISNVFVVMLENHSFDNILAMSGIPGLIAATTNDNNVYGSNPPYYVVDGAPLSMPTDPGHEFTDTVQQLAGISATYPSGGPYPSINNSGFAANYATTTSEGPVPSASDIGDIMACFNTSSQLPVTYQLATEYLVCDQWFSSMPGPTWPNRFFVHGASSNDWDSSPSGTQITAWEAGARLGFGFTYPNGSIYDSLTNAGIPWTIYNDNDNQFSDDPQNGSAFGAIPQVSAIHNISVLNNINSLSDFPTDLQNPYPYTYTFIEPNYGDVTGTYEGGSSQHPMDDVYGGEALIQYVYESIRNSPLWANSVLIITYDEHGGFYDSVAPGTATAPNDGSDSSNSVNGFTFNQYGVRVPAIIVSPQVPQGAVDHTIYDHSSIIASLNSLFNLNSLTDRDATANNILANFSASAVRTNCITKLNGPSPAMKVKREALAPEALAQQLATPIPESGNFVGFLQGALKAEFEMSAGTEADKKRILENFKTIKTRGQAQEYLRKITSQINTIRKAKK